MIELGARTLARMIRARELSAREVTAAVLARIEARNGAIGAYLRVTPERALADADAIDQQIARGDDAGLLAGVPVAVDW